MNALKTLLHIDEEVIPLENSEEMLVGDLSQVEALLATNQEKKDQLMETFGGITTTDNVTMNEPLNAPRGVKSIIPLTQ